MTDFSQSDIEQIQQHGLTINDIEKQLSDFRNGFPYADIVRPATIGDGIIELTNDDIEKNTKTYNDARETIKITKFVPASGAATRMFKDLFEFLSTSIPNTTSKTVVENISKFAFYDNLKKHISDNADAHDIISSIVSDSGLNYGNMPKALIPFHKYTNESRTSAAEHLVEGAQYASSNSTVHLHFTISPEHQNAFNNLMKKIVPEYEQKFGVRYDITTSQQSKSTDTIAVTPTNDLFRTSDGKLLFRPAGHGALIANLNNIDSDIIFIKNIDNVCHETKINDTVKYKRALAGILITTQQKIFKYLRDIDNDAYNKPEIIQFIKQDLHYDNLPQNPNIDELKSVLNRPIRVCGVVPNTGAPGGGPFWTRDSAGNITLQIIESSQIAPQARDIMNKSTHFNPVDLVCATRDYRGNKFDLNKFIDYNTGFISEKSANGEPLRAMERPGLWNGAMAHWHTIFVQVPNTTFTPVKIVSDLLSAAHSEQ